MQRRWRSSTSMVAVLLALLSVAFGAVDAVCAQDFRVTTAVSQRDPQSRRWQRVADSITLFHAGQVYDQMEKVGEVVIFEPAQSRFVILSFNGNQMATTLRFEELQQFLKVARSKTLSHVERMDAASADAAGRREALLFQISPRFDQTYDTQTRTLRLISPLVRYDVQTSLPQKPLVVQQYLQYADWAARMNYVLHSGSLYPEVRLAVNEALNSRGFIPTEVRLWLEGDTPLQLKAEHKFDWSLNSIDHSVIRRCEQARSADETRWVDFREYQRTLLAAMSDR